MVMKPSERDPGAPMILMELMNEAGFPPGTVNVIHGQHEGARFRFCCPMLLTFTKQPLNGCWVNAWLVPGWVTISKSK